MGKRIGISAIFIWVMVFSLEQTTYSNGMYWKFWFEIKIAASLFLIIFAQLITRSGFIRMEEISLLEVESKKLDVAEMQIRFWTVGALMGLGGGRGTMHKGEKYGVTLSLPGEACFHPPFLHFSISPFCFCNTSSLYS
jgi:hypothetical protein